MHEDHLGGLQGDEETKDKFGTNFSWNYGQIYCT